MSVESNQTTNSIENDNKIAPDTISSGEIAKDTSSKFGGFFWFMFIGTSILSVVCIFGDYYVVKNIAFENNVSFSKPITWLAISYIIFIISLMIYKFSPKRSSTIVDVFLLIYIAIRIIYTLFNLDIPFALSASCNSFLLELAIFLFGYNSDYIHQFFDKLKSKLTS